MGTTPAIDPRIAEEVIFGERYEAQADLARPRRQGVLSSGLNQAQDLSANDGVYPSKKTPAELPGRSILDE